MSRVCVFIFLLLFSLPNAGLAIIATDAEILAETSRSQQEIISVQAKFEQLKISDAFLQPVRSGGWMVFGKPGFLRWQYNYPETNGIMLHDNQVFQVRLNPDGSEQITEADATAAMLVGYIMEWVNFDIESLKIQYNITLLSRQPVVVELRTLDAQAGKFIKSITIEFAAANAAADKIIITEHDGDKTTITFNGVQIKRAVADKPLAP